LSSSFVGCNEKVKIMKRSDIEIKDTIDTRSASYLDIHFEIESEGRLRTILYDKREATEPKVPLGL